MNKEIINNQKTDFSYYELFLLNYLSESHPEKLDDTNFIKDRAEQASTVFEQSRLEGYSPEGSQELAITTLMEGLHFSKYDTIINVLENEYFEIFPENRVRALARKIMPFMEKTFAKYALTDDFSASLEYNQLYTEITVTIKTHIEEYGI